MARWRLDIAHYLFLDPPTEWEYKETSRETGRQNRMVAKVPRLLDPKDPTDCNQYGEIVVCDGHNPQRGDLIFLGDPTPDMHPLDDEAEAITQKFIDAGTWRKPEEGSEPYGEGLIKQFLAQIDRLGGIKPTPSVSASQVSPDAFASMQKQVAQLMEQNAQLMKQLIDKQEPETPMPPLKPTTVASTRRV